MAVDRTNSPRRGTSAPRPPRSSVPDRPGPTTALAWETILDLGEGPGPLHARLGDAVRAAVHAGRVPPGAALPPSRVLAETLGTSRWVVTEAYGQLVAEGFLESRTGSGTRVPLSAGTAPPSSRAAATRDERAV